jgi:16S rRNA (guanine527-N7)-methyltransferase
MDIIFKYFPDLTGIQKEQIRQLSELYNDWNEKINVISRKDIGSLYEKHVLHSLAIAKIIRFREGTRIFDVGTGGGFPGIPLAIIFPETSFYLIDSTGKKIKVVNAIASALNLKNVTAEQIRAEEVNKKFDFVVSRALSDFPSFVSLVRKNIKKEQINSLPNGILYLKGGDFEEEIRPFRNRVFVHELGDLFAEEYFNTKKLIYLPV